MFDAAGGSSSVSSASRPLTEAGPHDQRLDDVTQELRDALGDRHGRLAIKAYTLPENAGWPSVAAHYHDALTGWRREPAVPKHIRAARAQAWRDGKAVVAIALIDTPVAGEQRDYKVLVVAKEP